MRHDGRRCPQGAFGGEQGEDPEEAEERVERGQVRVGEDAGHDQEREPADRPGRAALAAPRSRA